ncbi:60S ribosomal protein L27, mitochondrial [Yamadazyma tenuis]|uniref:Uncharacterized protein n=1 Tax=Candida tenuis (strain ATCC 10573 / BCRC 21748 / CBS 615 / JCM 9827 / NBRC 10315 / NRRL Y-1498 / VKM Y-70) TaxID=590646 RepID=G3AZE4_CANTC|nr:uncharacterized protein CANTEDRAFT_101326 [Yamadazyma tenuis ATCC 10573]EGV66075.1 hypothetical protein CANTEDRAFT_101326 [Yamadazyma tenuis ATCC 10573]WEJ95576.1 60S ribosomal protein L27, mitochondrial [Yamadazyma tenuis]
MRASSVLNLQASATANLRRPWQTFRDGQIWYGLTKSGSKRQALTTKQGNKNYYKGTRSSGIGKLNNAGNYMVDWTKVRTYVVPADISSVSFKPLVSPNSPQLEQRYVGYADGPKDGELAWKNVVDFIEYGENYDVQDIEENEYKEEYVNPKIVQSQIELPEGIKQ